MEEIDKSDCKYEVKEVHVGFDSYYDNTFVLVVYFDGDRIRLLSSTKSNVITIYRTKETKPFIIHRISKESKWFSVYYYDLYVPDNVSFSGAQCSGNKIDAFGSSNPYNTFVA